MDRTMVTGRHSAPTPELLLRRSKPGCKLSIILLDWGVRESYHALEYLNCQTVDRSQYELIWLEFYQQQPRELSVRSSLLDQWLVAGYPREVMFHKHRLYNLGFLMAQGEICVVCDSDAIFTPTFVESILSWFAKNPKTVLHLDEIRNNDRRFYPFAYPSIGNILGKGCINWSGKVSTGLDDSDDMLHTANYGACMAAPRDAIMALGGADEHLDYLGYVCGPYDLTFRLVNAGYPEHWLRGEYLYHVWHPNASGDNIDYQGPHDGRCMAARSLQARAAGATMPYLENPWIADAREGRGADVDQLMAHLAERDESTWHVDELPEPSQESFMIDANFHGFNLFLWRERWFALRSDAGHFDPAHKERYPVLIEGNDEAHLRALIHYFNSIPREWWKRITLANLKRAPSWLGRKLQRLKALSAR